MSYIIALPIGYKPVFKHGDHDQSSHGSWATGTVSDLKSETIPTSELGRGKVRGEIISAKITVQNESFNISQINEKYDDGVAVMNLSLKDSENRNIGRLSASNQFVSNKEYAKIGNVEVRTNYQRKGVATAMLNFARKNMIDGIEIRHDWNMLSPSGKAWADVTKHGDHDQSTHGSWAHGNSALQAEYSRLKEGGIIESGKYIAEYDSVVTSRFDPSKFSRPFDPKALTNDASSHSGPQFRELIQRLIDRNEYTPEMQNKIEEISKKFLTADMEKVQTYFELEAGKQNLGATNSKIYIAGQTMRLSNYLDANNAEVRYEIAKAIHPLLDELRGGQLGKYLENHKRVTEEISSNVSKGFPVIAIDSRDFEKVLTDGRFKSQFESNKSGGMYDRSRRKTEEVEQGIPVNSKLSERPIYGYLASQLSVDENSARDVNNEKPTNTFTVNSSRVEQYGDLRVLLNDDVKERTTYTLRDSLLQGSLPQPLSEKVTRDNLVTAGLHARSSYGSGGKHTSEYVEVQIRNGVKVSDIKQIYIVGSQSSDSQDRERRVSEVKNMLSASGNKNLISKVEFLPAEKDKYRDDRSD